jgi:hypothetical protein
MPGATCICARLTVWSYMVQSAWTCTDARAPDIKTTETRSIAVTHSVKRDYFQFFFLLWDCFQLVYSVNGSNARSSTMTMQHPSHEKGRLRHLFDGQFRRQRSDGGEHQRSNMHFSPSVTHVSNNRMFTCSHLAGSSNSVEHRVRLTLISTHRQHCRCEHASTSTS